MWTTTVPEIDIVLRSTLIFFFVMIVMRMWGKKHLSEVSPFDLILMLIMSESLQNSLVSNEMSVTGGMLSFGTLIMLNVLCNRVAYFSKTAEKIIEGSPKILIRSGVIDEKTLRQESLTLQELQSMLRQHGLMSPSEAEWGIIEPNGKFSVIKKQEKSF